LERGGWVYPPLLWEEKPGNDRKRKEIERISHGNATALQRDDNGRRCNEATK